MSLMWKKPACWKKCGKNLLYIYNHYICIYIGIRLIYYTAYKKNLINTAVFAAYTNDTQRHWYMPHKPQYLLHFLQQFIPINICAVGENKMLHCIIITEHGR